MALTALAIFTSVVLALPAGVITPDERGGMLPGPAARPLGPAQIRSLLARRLSPSEVEGLLIPFEADDDIRRLAAEVIRGGHDEGQKLSALRAFFRRQGFLERYDRDGTRTARQVMSSGEGNCLSYANLFVAMARAVGLRAHYLDASRPGDSPEPSGSVLVQWGHVLVGVQIGPEWLAVEFDGRAGSPQRYRVVSDLEAIADFYNNLGAEAAWTVRGAGGFGSEEAIRAFRMATRVAPRFVRAWNNLGVALARAGRDAEAMAAYRRAVGIEPALAAPHANLGQLHARRGELPDALREMESAIRLSPANAYYRLFLGRLLARAGQPERALDELRAAARLDDHLFTVHLELGRLYISRGNLPQAERELERVLELVPGQRDATHLLDDLHHRDPAPSPPPVL